MSMLEKIKTIFNDNSTRTFLIDSNNKDKITYQQLWNKASAIAKYFEINNIHKGNRLLILSDNSIELAEIYFACLFSGIIVFPINPVLSKKEIEYIIEKSDATAILTTEKYLSMIHSFSAIENKIIFHLGEKKHSDKNTFNLDIKSLDKNINFLPFNNINEDDTLIIIYTSGTTGTPKGVIHTIRSLFGNGIEFCNAMGFNNKNRFLNILSMTYLGGYYNLLIIPFLSGGSVVISESFNPQVVTNFWKIVKKNNVNTLWLVPTIMAMLLEIDRGSEGKEYCKKNISYFISGTAPLTTDIRKRIEEKYQKKIYDNYGLSETLFISTNTPLQPSQNKGVGIILDSVKLKIIANKTYNTFHQETEGEITIKTPFLTKGYYELSTKNILKHNNQDWFATGDIGKIKNKNLYITGRKKDLIIRGGINISPLNIENIISFHPQVIECAVIGIPHKIMGEDIVAIIKHKKDADFSALQKELKQLCKENLSSVKQPSYFIELSEFPKTFSGKIQKRKLKTWAIEKKKTNHKIQQGVSEKYYRASLIARNSIEAISITYNNKVYEMKQKGEDIITLSLGEAFFDIPLFPFDDLPFPDIYHYSHSRGIIELRENLAKYFLTEYDVEFDPEKEIIITAGSKIAIHMTLMALLNQGDEVLIPEPAWVSYFEQVKLCYGLPVNIPYYENIFDYEKYITNRTKVIIINNPVNPSGKIYNIEELTYLHNLAIKYNLFIISDEAYSDFILNNDRFVSMANLDRKMTHTIVCNSISKNYGISGWRIGYLITNDDLIYQILKINQHLITCPATILELYIAKHFFEIIEITKPQIKAIVTEKNKIMKYMDSLGIKYLPGTATFYNFVSINDSKLDSIKFADKLLEENKVCVVPGIGYGNSCNKFIRVGVGTEPEERIKQGLDMIKNLIEKTK